jgi:hypothetical protein
LDFQIYSKYFQAFPNPTFRIYDKYQIVKRQKIGRPQDPAGFEKFLSNHAGGSGTFVISDAAATDKMQRKRRNVQKVFL